MIRFLELLIAVVIVAVLYVVAGAFLPDKRHVDHSMETNHPLRQVYDTLDGFRRFAAWHPLRQHDPRISYTLEGPLKGVGAKLNYASRDKRVGSGSWEIVESVQDEYVVYKVEDQSYGFNKLARFDLTPKDKTVQIEWSYGVEYGWDLRGRYAGLYVVRNVGDDIRSGLANLVGFIATMPNFDYKQTVIEEVVLEPVHLLYASTTSDRNITAVETAMLAALGSVRAAAASNNLQETGPARLITTTFGSDKYEFDVAIPVAAPGTAADDSGAAEVAATDTAMNDDSATPDAATPPPLAIKLLPPIEGLTLPENVMQGQSYGGRGLKTNYVGHPAALPLIRDQLRSYAAANGEDVQDRAFEEYLTEIADTSAEEASFNVYWPIR